MSAASAQTFSYMNKTAQQQSTGYRYAIDERFRWAAPVNEANFYAVSIITHTHTHTHTHKPLVTP